MLNNGLTIAQTQEFHRLCESHHRREITVYLMDNDQNILANISNRLVDGQVDVDWDAEVTRKLSCTLYDANYELGLDSTNVNNGAVYADRMISVYYKVWRPSGDWWYQTCVFTGPVSKVNRIGSFLSLEASGKEFFYYSSSWWKRTYPKGWFRHNVVRRILLDCGERYENYYVPDSPYKLGKDLAISFDNPLWPVIKSQVTAMNQIALVDARADIIMKPVSSVSQYTFRKFCSEPEINYNADECINSVLVIGATPKGKKSAINKRFVAPATHPLNPYAIGRIGQDGYRKGRFLSQVITDSGLTTMSQVITVGNAALKAGLLQGIEASFTAPVIPDLQEMDAYTIVHEGVATTSAMRKMTIPLTGPPIATYGYLRKIAPNKTVIRRRK